MPTIDIKLPTILINKETGETKCVPDDSPEVIAMEVRHISGKRWLTREDKKTLSKAADIMEELLERRKIYCSVVGNDVMLFQNDILRQFNNWKRGREK